MGIEFAGSHPVQPPERMDEFSARRMEKERRARTSAVLSTLSMEQVPISQDNLPEHQAETPVTNVIPIRGTELSLLAKFLERVKRK